VRAVVVVHAKNMKEPWCLATSLAGSTAAEVVKQYGRRFTIEETFRDTKDIRFGVGLKATHIGTTDRRDRLLSLFAIAHALLTLLGAASEASELDKMLKSSSREDRTHSLFWQGNFWYRQLAIMRDDLTTRAARWLVPLLARLVKGKQRTDLVVPALSDFGEDHLAQLFRKHLAAAKVARVELHKSTRTRVQSNFRSCRDSGITWLSMQGIDVAKIQRRAGHDTIHTTMGYVNIAEDIGGKLGTPFAPLPASLVNGSAIVELSDESSSGVPDPVTAGYAEEYISAGGGSRNRATA
jgi:hypothetical protein